MILTNEFLRRESIKRDISNASETRKRATNKIT